MTDRTPRHFNDDDELTSRIRLDDDDVIEYIDPDTGDRVIEHEPSGNTWRYQSDGTFQSPAVSTGQADIAGRDIISGDTETVTVPGDYATFEDAIDAVHPFISGHSVEIQITEDTTEDIYLPPAVTRRVAENQSSEGLQLLITGDGRTQVGSVFVDTVLGMGLSIQDLEITGANPYTNEDAAIEVYGSPGRVQVADCDISHTGNVGITSYSSNMTVNNIDLGTGLTTGVATKHGGSMFVVAGMTGNVSNVLLRANSGLIQVEDSSLPLSASSDGQKYKSEGSGVINGAWTEGVASGSYKRVSHDINSSSIDLQSGYVNLQAESGDTDTLETINGGETGTEIVLESNHEITVSHGVDNIYLDGSADFTLNHARDYLKLMKKDFGQWCEVGRGDNS